MSEAAARVKHDLGKYIAFQIRWVADDGSLEERRSALRADLLETRKGATGTASAVEVWAELRAGLLGMHQEPEVQAIDAAIGVIEGLLPGLRDGTAGESEVRKGVAAAFAVAEAAKGLAKRFPS